MAGEQSFTLTFKTVAQLTGLDQLLNGVQNGVRKIEGINTQLQTMAAKANAALSIFGAGLSIAKAFELGDKALEANKQLAAFKDQVMGSKEGSEALVEELTQFNEQLERTTGTTKGTARAIEQLLLQANATADQTKGATRAIIEFSAASAGTVQPLELAAVLSRRLRGATDETDISLARLGIRAKDFNGAIQELATRGGNSAEAMKKASGGMVDFQNSVHHAELAIGRMVNTIRIPFLTAFTGTLAEGKEKLDGVAGAVDKVASSVEHTGEVVDGWGVKFAIAAAAAGYSAGNILNVYTALARGVEVVIATAGLAANAAVLVVVGGVEKMTTKAIDALSGLTKFAAQTANTLSGGLVPDVSPQIDAAANKLKDSLGQSGDKLRNYLSFQVDAMKDVADKALVGLQKAVDAMSKGGAKMTGDLAKGELFNPEWLKRVKQQYADLSSYVSNVARGSRVVPPGADSADKAKAATDALAQSKFQVAAAEEAYKQKVEETKLLEDSGQISHEQANARNIQARRDLIAELEREKAALPELIARLDAVGNTKGAAEARLEFQKLGVEITKLKIEAGNDTFFGKIRSQIQQLASEWGDLGKQVGGFLTQTFQNFASTAGNAIGQLIFRTGNWKQSILQLGQSFVSSLATMLIQWVLSRTIMSALNKAFGAADAAAAKTEAAGAAAAWGPAATAASIASYGAAAGLGLTAYLSALGIGTAATIGASAGGSFRDGGWTGDGPADRPAGIVHNREVVMPEPAVNYWGKDFLVNMAYRSIARPSVARGGGGGGGGDGWGSGSQPPQVNVAIFDDRQSLEKWAQSTKGRKAIIDVVSGRRIDLGF